MLLRSSPLPKKPGYAFEPKWDGFRRVAARLPYRERRRRLEALSLAGPSWCTTVTTDDGAGLWAWVCECGLEGVVAKRLSEPYRRASGDG
jgi:ATP-dependent DNA ligase